MAEKAKLTATSSVVVKAEPAAVWATLTDPDLVSQAFFGARVDTDWRVGSPITFTGEWDGKSFEDKGEIRRVAPNQILEFTHWSPLSGTPDDPANYATVTFTLTPRDGGTELSITQSNVADEKAKEHSENNWAQVLAAFKRLAER